ncbi:ATP-binding cassette domain-containing protein [Gulosibacter sp. GYB002]|uniref:ABC transporter ATP-binding protein/permease n=1 Tax=Gulosibacter sp. GYB002 TaxID=2994391 RepID=UPI002F960E62
MNEPLIRLEHAYRTYGAAREGGIRDATLVVNSGEFVAITGPSGSGKSTLLHLLGLLDNLDNGVYYLEGIETTQLSDPQRNSMRAQNIGFVFQDSQVLEHYTALDNANLGLRIRGVEPRICADASNAALGRVGLRDKAEQRAGSMSGGERQRVAIARAIATSPQLILADEPTGSLDSESSKRVFQYLRSLHKSGATIVTVTHDEDLAAEADRRIRIRDGHIVSDSGPVVTSVRERDSSPVQQGTLRNRVLGALVDGINELQLKWVRTLTLLLVFALGVGSLVAALGLSQTAAVQIAHRIDSASLDSFRIGYSGAPLLDESGAIAAWKRRLAQMPHVESVGYTIDFARSEFSVARLPGEPPVEAENLRLVVADQDYLSQQELTFLYGKSPNLLAETDLGVVSFVGRSAADVLGIGEPGTGKSILINGVSVPVVEVFESRDDASLLIDNSIIVSRELLPWLTGGELTMHVKTELGYIGAVAEAAPNWLDPANPTKFQIETIADLRELRGQIATDVENLVAAVGAVLLLLAAASMSALLNVSIQSRRGEIALRKAVGATRSDVVILFASEGAVIGQLGGAIGTFAGALIVHVVAIQRAWVPSYEVWIPFVAWLLSLVVGALAAAIPAIIAARRPPVLDL